MEGSHRYTTARSLSSTLGALISTSRTPSESYSQKPSRTLSSSTCSVSCSDGPRRQSRISTLNEGWQVPGGWLEIYKTNPAAKRIEQGSEVLQKLAELKKREEERKQPQPWIKRQSADILFAVVIIAYGLMTGVDVEVTVSAWPGEVSKQYQIAMLVAQTVFVVVFLVELLLRVRAEGIQYCLPFLLRFRREPEGKGRPRLYLESCNPAGCLDTAIICISTAELAITLSGLEGVSLAAAGPMRLLRIVRLVRIMKGLMVFEQLKLLCHGMVSSLGAVFWAFVLLAVLMYLGSLFCVILLGKNPALSDYFGGVGQALFTHFMIVTLEAWPDISDEVMDASSPLWGIYFMVFICVSSLALMNLVTGVVCEKLLDVARSEDSEGQNLLASFREDQECFLAKFQAIFQACDQDENGFMSNKEFTAMLERSDMRRLLKMMEVSYNFDALELFDILDERGKGALCFDELAQALLRLRGSQQKIHSLMLQRDVIQRHRREAQRVAELEGTLLQQMKSELSAVEETVTAKLEELQDSMLPPSPQSPRSPRSLRSLRGGRAEGEAQGPESRATLSPGQARAPRVTWLKPHPLKELQCFESANFSPQLLSSMEVMPGYDDTCGDARHSAPVAVAAAGSTAVAVPAPVVAGAAAATATSPLTQEASATEDPKALQEPAPGKLPGEWVRVAGSRLEALLEELETLHSWAQDLASSSEPTGQRSSITAALEAVASATPRK